jgi:hypothetical protein
MGAAIVVLTRALDGLRAVGHGEIPASKTKKRPRTMLTEPRFVNPQRGLRTV